MTIENDNIDEEDEDFLASLTLEVASDSSVVQLQPAEATILIGDDDGQLQAALTASTINQHSLQG